MLDKISINILTKSALLTQDDGKLFLDLMLSYAPSLLPDRYGNYEPLQHKFNLENMYDTLQCWQQMFIWKKKISRLVGTVGTAYGLRAVHGGVSVSLNLKQANISECVEFTRQVAQIFKADFASIHLLTMPEIEQRPAPNTVNLLNPAKQVYSHDITTYNLLKSIPNIYWATILGPAYIPIFGRDRLRSTPAYQVDELPNDMFYIQLSESPEHLISDYDRIDTIRRIAKEHLNNNAFYMPEAVDSHKYNVPIFELEYNKIAGILAS